MEMNYCYPHDLKQSHLCPCGSGRKYKKCHGLKPNEPVPMNMPIEVIQQFRIKAKANRLQEKQFCRNYGDVRQPASCKAWGKRLIAVCGNIFSTSRHATFHDFLIDYICDLLNEEWLRQDSNDVGQEHPLRRYYKDTIVEEKSYRVSKNPSYMQFITLAYDLYVIANEGLLNKRMVDRLKHIDQYPGVRYELLVATTFLRAGFRLEYEDESDGTQPHVEFTAIHKERGVKFHVEGKRCVSYRHKYGELVNDAIKKKKDLPLIVFVDMNKREKSARDYIMNRSKLVDLVNKKIIKDENKCDLFDLLILTNHPWEYFNMESGVIQILRRYVFGRKEIDSQTKRLIDILRRSFDQYANVPEAFPPNS